MKSADCGVELSDEFAGANVVYVERFVKRTAIIKEDLTSYSILSELAVVLVWKCIAETRRREYIRSDRVGLEHNYQGELVMADKKRRERSYAALAKS